jgi:hypothetical protein
MDEFPISLVNKLQGEQQLVFSSLSSDEADRSLSLTKDHIRRRLLAGTPKALDVIEYVMTSSFQPKDRLAAASKWLDVSPAVEDNSKQTAAPVLPVEALKIIIEGMAAMFGTQQSIKAAVDQQTTKKEVLIERAN